MHSLLASYQITSVHVVKRAICLTRHVKSKFSPFLYDQKNLGIYINLHSSNGTKHAHRCTLPACTCIDSSTHTHTHTHVPPRVNVQHHPSTAIVQIASFSPAASPLRSVNRVRSIRVISCAEWTSCLTGCGLRGSWAQETRWAEAETPTPP